MTSIVYKGDLTCAIQCQNLDAAIAWYKDHLDFDVDYKLADMGWCELSTPTSQVTLGISQVEKPEVTGGATLVWGVKDIAAARKELEGKGVRFDGDTITIEGMVKLCTFFDLDGNKLMLSQSLQQG